MLLMYTRASESARESAAEPNSDAYRAIIDEYRQWAMDRAAEGRLVDAEELADVTRIVAQRDESFSIEPSAHTDRALGGYFLITASSLDDPLTLAKTHPHLKYGGEVEVRPIEKTN